MAKSRGLLGLYLAFLASIANASDVPTVTLKNGTYSGTHNAHYNVDYFLGIPYAQPPVGNLRLALPRSLNASFDGVRNSTEFSDACVQFSAATIDRPISEDCLSINVIRPAGYENESLPVLVWIYGGGLIQGTNYDPRYNGTFLVNNSVAMGQPMIFANINYRLNGYGFLDSPELRKHGLTNLGLRDQRLALSWVQENIGAFGGDKKKVTIWGQSAGGRSVGAQLLAFGGRDDFLFRAAIADSGGPLGSKPAPAEEILATWNSILNATGCQNSGASLECLRKAPADQFLNAVNHSDGSFGVVIDGDFLQTYSSNQLKDGNFLRVPLMIGSNTDEGTQFIGSEPCIGCLPTVSYPNESSFTDTATSYIADASKQDEVVRILEALYPDITSIGIPHTLHGRPNSTFGAQWKRVAALVGDMSIHRGRRLSSQMWSKYQVPAYSYHFNQWPIGGLPDFMGTTHFTEIQYVFDNEDGNGYLAPWYPAGSEFAGDARKSSPLARLMSRMWISFVNNLDPNKHGVEGVPVWPEYATDEMDASQGYGVNLKFAQEGDDLAVVESDTWRAEAMQYLLDNSASTFGS